jgi:uncharacterized protein (DUF488 family)
MAPDASTRTILTIGHGTRPVERLVEQLRAAGVARLVDVRTAPGSRRNPQYGRDALAAALERAGIAYEWQKNLGGFRRPNPDSPHRAIRNDAFRGYADHMDTQTFGSALADLEATSVGTPSAVMCAESVWWRCHRRMLADALLVDGWTVVHLMPDGRSQPHRLHPDARVEGGRPIYDGGQPTLGVAGPEPAP